MIFEISDLVIIGVYCVVTIGIALYGGRKSGSSLQEYFTSGGKLPWWIAGTSMVATTFAADTPLWVAGKVALHGVSANWLWWSMAASGLLTVFFFARLWRRAGVLTDLEFIELRYSGKPSAFLRGFRSLYTGFGLNCIIMAWVNLALMRISEILLPQYNAKLVVIICLLSTLFYVGIGGLRGLVMADTFQFLIALGGCILLAIFALNHPYLAEKGGLEEGLAPSFFRFFPDLNTNTSAVLSGDTQKEASSALSWDAFLVYILILWWASWYPGSEPGGGGYITQRIFSVKNEKQAILSALWFVVAHYCIRSWPWILSALVAAVLYPYLKGTEKETGFVYLIKDVLPSPWKGLLFAAFLGAYMSTLSTHLNLGSSYVVNDFYKRFLVKGNGEKHYIFISRLVTVILAICSLLLTFYFMPSIQVGWSLLLEGTAGIGFVLILRWYWWRINSWSEITAMLTPVCIIFVLRVIFPLVTNFTMPPAPKSLLIIVPISVIVILLVTYLTPKENKKHIMKFYERVRPLGPGWYAITKQKESGLMLLFFTWLSSIAFIYSLLFLIGSIVLGFSLHFSPFLPYYLLSFLFSTFILIFLIRKDFSRECNREMKKYSK